MAFDVYVDDTLIGHASCNCKTYGPTSIAIYDTTAPPDGSSHTLKVVLTETRTGAKVTQSWTFNIDRTPPQISADGELRWAPNGYVNGSPHNLTLSAYDGLSGVAEVRWWNGYLPGGFASNPGAPPPAATRTCRLVSPTARQR